MTLTHFGLWFTRLRPFLFDSLFPCAPPLYRRQHLSSSYRVAANCPQSECAPLVLLRPAWTIKRTCGICMCDANTIPQIFDDRHDGCDNGRVLSHGATPQSGPLHHGGATRPSHALRDQRPPRTSPARLAASPAGLASTGPLPPPRLSCFADSSLLRVFFTVCHCDATSHGLPRVHWYSPRIHPRILAYSLVRYSSAYSRIFAAYSPRILRVFSAYSSAYSRVGVRYTLRPNFGFTQSRCPRALPPLRFTPFFSLCPLLSLCPLTLCPARGRVRLVAAPPPFPLTLSLSLSPTLSYLAQT